MQNDEIACLDGEGFKLVDWPGNFLFKTKPQALFGMLVKSIFERALVPFRHHPQTAVVFSGVLQSKPQGDYGIWLRV